MKEIIPFEDKGSIIIQFRLAGKIYKLSPVRGGKYNNQTDLEKAKRVALQISLDIENNEFDPTLAKYKPKKPDISVLTTLKGRTAADAKRDLAECKEEIARSTISVGIWDKYVEFKRPSVSPSTMLVERM